jgi:hypothetical protein
MLVFGALRRNAHYAVTNGRLANKAQANAHLADELEHNDNTRWFYKCGYLCWFACTLFYIFAKP